MTGKITEIPAFNGDNKLDVSQMHPGTYILQVQTGDELYHQKIFIQHVF